MPPGGARLLPLAADHAFLSGKRVRDDEARCLVSVDRSMLVTACAKRHSYRSVQALTMPFQRQPSEQKALAFADERFRVAQRSNRGCPPGRRAASWKAGSRTLVRFARTRE